MSKEIIQQILGKHLQNDAIDMLKINIEDLSAEIVAAMRSVNQEMLEAAWNAQADEFNQWDALSENEKLNWRETILSAELMKTIKRAESHLNGNSFENTTVLIQDLLTALKGKGQEQDKLEVIKQILGRDYSDELKVGNICVVLNIENKSKARKNEN